MSVVTPSCNSYASPGSVHLKQAKQPDPNKRVVQTWRPCRRQQTNIVRVQAGAGHDPLSKQPEELSATTVDGGKTLTEVAAPGGSGTLAVPLSGVVLPEGLDAQEQRKRLWFAAIKPPMYTVALIPVLVNFSHACHPPQQCCLTGHIGCGPQVAVRHSSGWERPGLFNLRALHCKSFLDGHLCLHQYHRLAERQVGHISFSM